MTAYTSAACACVCLSVHLSLSVCVCVCVCVCVSQAPNVKLFNATAVEDLIIKRDDTAAGGK